MTRSIFLFIAFMLGFCCSGNAQIGETLFDGPLEEDFQTCIWTPSLIDHLGRVAVGDGRMTSSIYGGWVFPTNGQNLSYWYPSTSFDAGGAFGLSAGRRFDSRWRAELDFTFRRNLPEASSPPFLPLLYGSSAPFYLSPALEGNFDTYSGMLNFYYEFDRELNHFLVPYAGFGIGIAYFDTDLAWDGIGSTVSNESAFAFQTIAGVSAKLFPRFELFTEYRFFYAMEVDFTFPEQVTPYYTYPEFQSAYKFTTSNLFMGFRLSY